jgi:8-oxo-dGTP diphosphatase
MKDLLPYLWRSIEGRLQWLLLWLLNDKFIIGVAGVVFDEQDRILLMRHRFWDLRVWGLPGGVAKRGETVEAAFAREVREETGLKVGSISLLRVLSGFQMRVETHFSCKILSGTQRIDPSEILEARFFSPDEIPDTLIPTHQEIVRLALNAQRTSQILMVAEINTSETLFGS